MSYEIPNLDECRGAGDYATAIAGIEARIGEIDAAFNGRPLDAESRAEFAALQEARKEAKTAKAEVEERSAYVASLAADTKRTERPEVRTVRAERTHVPENIWDLSEYRTAARSDDEYRQALRDGAMKAVERAAYSHPESKPDVEQGHIQTMLDTIDTPDGKLARRILATGSPTYRRAFNKFVLSMGGPLMLTAEEQRAAALAVQVDATGGFAVPFSFDPTFLETGAWTTINPYRRLGTVKQIVGTDTYHGVTVAGVTATRAAEAAAATEQGPATGQISAIVGRVQAQVSFSAEMAQDRPDLPSELASLFAQAKDTEEESSFSVGVGDALGNGFNPIGMFAAHGTSGAFTHVATAASNTLAIGDLYSLEAGVPIRWRANAEWFMGRAMIRAIQALETTGGQLFGGLYYNAVGYPVNSPTGNTGLRLLQYPVNEVPSAPTALTDDSIIACLGDPKNFYIIDRIGMSVQFIPFLFGAGQGNLVTGQQALYAMWRNTAKPANVDGMRQLAVLP